jgi:hypothetical protein
MITTNATPLLAMRAGDGKSWLYGVGGCLRGAEDDERFLMLNAVKVEL